MIGFGEAGSETIRKNIANNGDVNAMIAGRKIVSIFGFCDIRNFTDCTEILQTDVMVFVNTIAYIVHRIIDELHGSANKNIGDAFLLTWKIPENIVNINKNDQIQVLKDIALSNLADCSVIAFIKIIIEIKTNEKI